MEKKIERRINMIIAAQKLFAKDGFEKTTMQKIADEAKVGVATLFRYFPHKEALIIEVIKMIIEKQVPYFENIYATDKPGIEKVDDVLTTYIRFIFEENRNSIKLLESFELYIVFNKIELSLLEQIKQAYGEIGNIISKIVKEGKEDGSILLSISDEQIVSTMLNMFGTSVKKYSLYSILPDTIIPVPTKENLLGVKTVLIAYLRQQL